MSGTVHIKGVAYETVHARLEAAHDTNARPKGIRSVATSPLEVAGRIVVCATVTFDDGRAFSGISEAKLDATSGADRDAPIECAETSAVGRALANAGYFGSGGLASQDEIRSAQARGARFNRPAPPAAPLPAGSTGSGAAPRPVAQSGTPRLAAGLEAPPPPPWPGPTPAAGGDDLERLRQAYSARVREAVALGVPWTRLPHDADRNTIVDLGVALKDALDAKRAEGAAPSPSEAGR